MAWQPTIVRETCSEVPSVLNFLEDLGVAGIVKKKNATNTNAATYRMVSPVNPFEPLLQHSLALAEDARDDAGGRHQMVRPQDQHASGVGDGEATGAIAGGCHAYRLPGR